MAQNRNHQGAHGIGQVEEQLNQQAEAAEAMQGINEADQELNQAAKQEKTSLDKLI